MTRPTPAAELTPKNTETDNPPPVTKTDSRPSWKTIRPPARQIAAAPVGKHATTPAVAAAQRRGSPPPAVLDFSGRPSRMAMAGSAQPEGSPPPGPSVPHAPTVSALLTCTVQRSYPLPTGQGLEMARPPAHAPRGGPPPPSPNTISRIFWVRHTGCGYRSRLSLVLVFSSCATEGQLRRRSIARPSSARRSAPAFASLSWADALAALGCRQCEPGSVRSLSAVRLL